MENSVTQFMGNTEVLATREWCKFFFNRSEHITTWIEFQDLIGTLIEQSILQCYMSKLDEESKRTVRLLIEEESKDTSSREKAKCKLKPKSKTKSKRKEKQGKQSNIPEKKDYSGKCDCVGSNSDDFTLERDQVAHILSGNSTETVKENIMNENKPIHPYPLVHKFRRKTKKRIARSKVGHRVTTSRNQSNFGSKPEITCINDEQLKSSTPQESVTLKESTCCSDLQEVSGVEFEYGAQSPQQLERQLIDYQTPSTSSSSKSKSVWDSSFRFIVDFDTDSCHDQSDTCSTESETNLCCAIYQMSTGLNSLSIANSDSEGDFEVIDNVFATSEGDRKSEKGKRKLAISTDSAQESSCNQCNLREERVKNRLPSWLSESENSENFFEDMLTAGLDRAACDCQRRKKSRTDLEDQTQLNALHRERREATQDMFSVSCRQDRKLSGRNRRNCVQNGNGITVDSVDHDEHCLVNVARKWVCESRLMYERLQDIYDQTASIIGYDMLCQTVVENHWKVNTPSLWPTSDPSQIVKYFSPQTITRIHAHEPTYKAELDYLQLLSFEKRYYEQIVHPAYARVEPCSNPTNYSTHVYGFMQPVINMGYQVYPLQPFIDPQTNLVRFHTPIHPNEYVCHKSLFLPFFSSTFASFG